MNILPGVSGRARLILVLACMVALIAAGLGIAAYSEGQYKAQATAAATVQAQVLAKTVTAALAFGDRAAMQEYVGALEANAEVDAVGVYDETGRLMASFARSTLADRLSQAATTERLPGRIIVFAPVEENATALGTVYLRHRTEPMLRRLSRYIAPGLLVLMAFMMLAMMTADAEALRRANRNLKIEMVEREKAEEALRQDERMETTRRLEGVVNSVMDALITVDENQRILMFNPAAERMFGVPADEAMGASIERFIPERFRAGHAEHIRRFKDTGETSRRMGALGAISGLRANGEEFPLEASISQVEIGGATLSTVVLRDITARKANEEARLLLSREVDHRAKNALAVVQSLVSLTQAATKEEFIAAVRGRVSALGRAHSVLSQNRWEGADLAQIVVDETSPYQKPGKRTIEGPPVVLAPNAVQPVSLLLHELATNAVKYGALSVEQGLVRIGWRVLPDQRLELSWVESGGPPVTEPSARGFGSTLISEVGARQLRADLDIRWPVEGMTLSLILPAAAYHIEAPAHPPATGETRRPTLQNVNGARILVVEDEALIAMELCTELTSLGWDILGPAASVEEAIQLLAEHPPPDAAVLDVNLAGKLVYPLAERLMSASVPFVFCTGYERLDGHEPYVAYPVFRKPANVSLLTDELRRVRQAA